ncbi:hypothetical protein [Afipia felis]|uniref:hypothetical protein n=1 Tax=Afipia felis TaxID=1035 RepID=UPI003D320C5F
MSRLSAAITTGNRMIATMPGANPTTAIAPTIVSAPRSFVSDNRACSATNDSTDRSAPASTDRTANDRTRRATYQRATPGAALRVCFSEKRNCHDCKQRQQEQESIHFIPPRSVRHGFVQREKADAISSTIIGLLKLRSHRSRQNLSYVMHGYDPPLISSNSTKMEVGLNW